MFSYRHTYTTFVLAVLAFWICTAQDTSAQSINREWNSEITSIFSTDKQEDVGISLANGQLWSYSYSTKKVSLLKEFNVIQGGFKLLNYKSPKEYVVIGQKENIDTDTYFLHISHHNGTYTNLDTEGKFITKASISKNSNYIAVITDANEVYIKSLKSDSSSFAEVPYSGEVVKQIEVFDNGDIEVIQNTAEKWRWIASTKEWEFTQMWTVPTNELIKEIYKDPKSHAQFFTTSNYLIYQKNAQPEHQIELNLKRIIGYIEDAELLIAQTESSHIIIVDLFTNRVQKTTDLLLSEQADYTLLGHHIVQAIGNKTNRYDLKNEIKDWYKYLNIQKRIFAEEYVNQEIKALTKNADRDIYLYYKQELGAAYKKQFNQHIEELKQVVSQMPNPQLPKETIQFLSWEDENLNAKVHIGETVSLLLDTHGQLVSENQFKIIQYPKNSVWEWGSLKNLENGKSEISVKLIKAAKDQKEHPLQIMYEGSTSLSWNLNFPYDQRDDAYFNIQQLSLEPTTHSDSLILSIRAISNIDKEDYELNLIYKGQTIDAYAVNKEKADLEHRFKLKSDALNSTAQISFGSPLLSIPPKDIGWTNSYPYQVHLIENSTTDLPHQQQLLTDIPEAVHQKKNAYAVIIGNQNYKNVEDVNYAIRDARMMYTYFTEVVGIPKENVLVRENATLSDFQFLFGSAEKEGRLADLVNSGKDEIYVYYSGHGMPSIDLEDAYMLATDSDPIKTDLTAYSLSLFYEKLRLLKAKRSYVFMESCFSGVTANGNSLIKNASPVIEIKLKIPLLANENVAIFTACAEKEIASWHKQSQLGMFTYRLLQALHGDADSNNDSKISVQEAYQYLIEGPGAVPEMAKKAYGRSQTPVLYSNMEGQTFVEFKNR